MKGTLEEIMVEDDVVVLRHTTTATQTGPLGAIPPTGNVATWEGLSFVRIACGKIVEAWTEIDGFGRLQQLTGETGAFPASTPLPASTASPSASPAACASTSEEEAKDLALRWLNVWNTRDVDALDSLGARDYLYHWGSGPDTNDLDTYKQNLGQVLSAFPDFHATFDDVIIDQDLVAIRWTATGTHQGQYGNLAPTGKSVTFTGINIFRVDCGKVVEGWGQKDEIGLQGQLGVGLPGTPAAATPAS